MGIIILGSYTSLGQTAASEATATTRAAGGEAITSAQVFVYFSIWKIQSDFFSFLYCLVLHSVLKISQKVSFSTLQQNSGGWRLLLSETISSITSDFSMMKLLQFPISLRKQILQWSIRIKVSSLRSLKFKMRYFWVIFKHCDWATLDFLRVAEDEEGKCYFCSIELATWMKTSCAPLRTFTVDPEAVYGP